MTALALHTAPSGQPHQHPRGGPPSGWTDERVERLKALVADGLSASEIGAELGVSRNAVIGAISRRGLKLKGAPHIHRPPKPRAPRRKTNLALTFNQQVTMAAEEFVEPATSNKPTPHSRLVPLVELEFHHCRYPIDCECGKQWFCAADQWQPWNGSDNYCQAHSKLCIQAVRR